VSNASRASELATRRFERILLVKPSSLGDVIHALPVMHALRAQYPDARIDWLVGTAFAPILEGNRDISEMILFDRRKFSRLGLRAGPTRDFLRLIAQLRERNYDLVIDLQGLFRSGFLTWATGTPVRIGFADAREGAALFYSHKIPPSHPDIHAVDRNLRIADLLGFSGNDVVFPMEIPQTLRTQIRSLLESHFPAGQAFVAIAPGARWETKLWAADNFAQVIDALHSNNKTRCVLLGGPDDVDLCERIAGMCRSKPISLAGRTSIREMVAIIEQAGVLICQDSAPMHIAVALNRPLVCLTGPTNPARTGPYRRQSDVLRVPLPCSPCYFRKLTQCPHQHRCMTEIRVDDVVNGVLQRLAR